MQRIDDSVVVSMKAGYSVDFANFLNFLYTFTVFKHQIKDLQRS